MHEVILLIDDSEAFHQLVKSHLSPRFKIISAFDGKSGLIAAAKSRPDLILLDVGMPAMQGYNVCRRLQADRATRSIPVVFLSAAKTPSERIRGLECGACDYITKPFAPAELLARIRAILRTQRTLAELGGKTMVDELTGLPDRRYFEMQLNTGLAAARRTNRPLGCILLDIDKMHVLNGAFGRELGDKLLVAISGSLLKTCRQEDVLCRYDGDEFAILVSGAKASALELYAGRARQAVRSAVICDSDREIRATASLGVSLWRSTDKVPMVDAAEEALGRARSAGGDRIFFDDAWMDLRAAA